MKAALPVVAALALLACLLPFLLLSAYNHPSTDDYCQCIRVHDAPARGETRLEALTARARRTYRTWGGRYVTHVAHALCPIAFDRWDWYRLSSVAICLLFLAALFFLARTANRFLLHAPAGTLFAGAAGLAIVSFARLPAAADGFFWHSGYMAHTFPLVTSLFLCAALIRFFRAETGRGRIASFLLLLLCLFLSVGGDEMAMTITLFLAASVFLIARWAGRVGNGYLAVLLAAAAGSAALEILAPGNAAMIATPGCAGIDRYPLPVLSRAIRLAADRTSSWILSLDLLLLTALGLGLFLSMDPAAVRRLSRRFLPTLLLVLAAYFLLWLPPSYALPAAPPRVLNPIYCYFLIGWLIVVFSLAARLFGAARRPTTPSWAFSLLLIALAAWSLTDRSSNVHRAWRDLLDGSAAAYDREMESRYRTVAEAKRAGRTDRLVLPPLSVKPKSLYVGDITSDPSDWRNVGYQAFFKIREIVIADAGKGGRSVP